MPQYVCFFLLPISWSRSIFFFYYRKGAASAVEEARVEVVGVGTSQEQRHGVGWGGEMPATMLHQP